MRVAYVTNPSIDRWCYFELLPTGFGFYVDISSLIRPHKTGTSQGMLNATWHGVQMRKKKNLYNTHHPPHHRHDKNDNILYVLTPLLFESFSFCDTDDALYIVYRNVYALFLKTI